MDSEQPQQSENLQVIEPEGRLLSLIFYPKSNSPPIHVPLKFEQARKQAIEEGLSTLNPKEQDAIIRQYLSLRSLPQTLTPTDRGVTKILEDKTIKKALAKMRHPTRSDRLRLFLPQDENSFGKVVFGVDMGYELHEQFPNVNIKTLTIDQMALQTSTLSELVEKGVIPLSEGVRIAGLENEADVSDRRLTLAHVITNPVAYPLSESARANIIDSLKELDQET